MSVFHRTTRLPGLPSYIAPRLCLSFQQPIARPYPLFALKASSCALLPHCARQLSSLSRAPCHAQPAIEARTSPRLRTRAASIPSMCALQMSTLREQLSPRLWSSSTGSSHSTSSPIQPPRARSLRYLLLVGLTATSTCFILGWYSQTAMQLYLHDLLPIAPSPTAASTSMFSSFWSSSVEIFGYRLPLPVAAILAINVAVSLAWRVPSLSQTMFLHFTTDYYRVFHQRMWHTLFTHAFSHISPMHLLFNCMAFATIAPSITTFMSDPQFVAFYLGSAAVSSLVGFALLWLTVLPYNRAKQMRIPSLGASGAVYACFAASALTFPDSQYNILLIPYNIPASTILPCAALFDVGGLIYNRYRGSPLGHGAHLGGLMCGVALYKLWIEPSPMLKRVKAERERRRLWAQQSQRR